MPFILIIYTPEDAQRAYVAHGFSPFNGLAVEGPFESECATRAYIDRVHPAPWGVGMRVTFMALSQEAQTDG